MELDRYVEQIISLKRANIAGAKAPHKPILLLSIIDLVESGAIVSNHIELNDAFEVQFARNWNKYIGDSLIFQAKIATPFWHLQNESFWRLVSKDGVAVTKNSFRGNFYSVKNLRKQVAYAEIDRELFLLLQSQESREVLKELIISTYLLEKFTQKEAVLPVVIVLGLLISGIA